MLVLTILHHYLLWHYATALREMAHVAANLLWFVVHFFSLPQLARSLFAPYRRITEERHRRFNLEDIAGYIIINLISRIIGFLLRFIILIAGLLSLVMLTVGIVIAYIFWLFAPIVLIALLIAGFRLLIM